MFDLELNSSSSYKSVCFSGRILHLRAHLTWKPFDLLRAERKQGVILLTKDRKEGENKCVSWFGIFGNIKGYVFFKVNLFKREGWSFLFLSPLT